MDGDGLVKAPLCCSYRLALSILSCFGFMLLFALRFNMNAIINCMVNQTAVLELSQNENTNHRPHTNLTIYNMCKLPRPNRPDTDHVHESSDTQEDKDGEFVWPVREQNMIQMAFLCGYLTTQIPGGLLSQRFGGKQFCGWSIFACGIISILTPLAARTGYILVIIMRFTLGMSQGFIWPAMMAMWSRWAPPLERHRLTSCCFGGAALGVVTVYPLSNLFCHKDLGGWESLFFISGSFSVVWSVVWSLFAFNSPDEHPHISITEMGYIESSLGTYTPLYAEVDYQPPWKLILTSSPFWAVVAVHVCSDFTLYELILFIRIYLHETLNYDTHEGMTISGLPYIGLFTVSVTSGIIYDFVLMKQMWSLTSARRAAISMATIIPAVLITSCIFLDCTTRVQATSLLMAAIACSGLQFGCGYLNNFNDIAPAHSAVMYGISGTFATMSEIIALPLINFNEYGHHESHWKSLFFIIASMNIIGCVIFLAYGSAEVEDWARVQTDEATTDISIESDKRMRAAHRVIKRSQIKGNLLPDKRKKSERCSQIIRHFQK